MRTLKKSLALVLALVMLSSASVSSALPLITSSTITPMLRTSVTRMSRPLAS